MFELPKILELQISVEAVACRLRTWLGDPDNVAHRVLAAHLAGTARPLVSAVALRADPVEGVKVPHDRNHRHVRLHVRDHYPVEALRKTTMRVYFHQVLALRDARRLVGGRPLP